MACGLSHTMQGDAANSSFVKHGTLSTVILSPAVAMCESTPVAVQTMILYILHSNRALHIQTRDILKHPSDDSMPPRQQTESWPGGVEPHLENLGRREIWCALPGRDDHTGWSSGAELTESMRVVARSMYSAMSKARYATNDTVFPVQGERQELYEYGNSIIKFMNDSHELRSNATAYDRSHAEALSTTEANIVEPIEALLLDACSDYTERYADIRKDWGGTILTTRDGDKRSFVIAMNSFLSYDRGEFIQVLDWLDFTDGLKANIRSEGHTQEYVSCEQ